MEHCAGHAEATTANCTPIISRNLTCVFRDLSTFDRQVSWKISGSIVFLGPKLSDALKAIVLSMFHPAFRACSSRMEKKRELLEMPDPKT